jgi:hypothetical protein
MAEKRYSIEEALKAQRALRIVASLPEESFAVPTFVGMISDEIEILRGRGLSDALIAEVIAQNSEIKITDAEIGKYYASPNDRRQHEF